MFFQFVKTIIFEYIVFFGSLWYFKIINEWVDARVVKGGGL